MTGFKLRHALGDTPVNEGLRFEDDPSFFGLCLEHVAYGHADHFPHMLRDDHLILIFDGDNGHDRGIVQLFFTLASRQNLSRAGEASHWWLVTGIGRSSVAAFPHGTAVAVPTWQSQTGSRVNGY